MIQNDEQTVDLATTRWPDFFIVGAPKCGTTSMYAYLNQHRDVHFSEFKELHYFGADLIWRKRVVSRCQALTEYRNAPKHKTLGEASVFYLYSTKAALEIYAHNPDARIVIMIRNPLTMIPSLFRQSIRTGDEIHLSLTNAMDAEPARRQGNIDISMDNPGVMQQLYYSDVALYSAQIARYRQVFGADKICVIEYANFTRDPNAAVSQIALFLDLPPFQPIITQHNKGRSVRHKSLWRSIKHPNQNLRRIWRFLLPNALRTKLLLTADRLVFKSRTSSSPAPQEQLRIAQLYANDVCALEDITGLDLSHWHADFNAVTAPSALK